MKTIHKADIQGPFVVPPECAGQMVSRSYACTETAILERRYDRSSRTETIEAYRWPAGDAGFDPQNGTPELGESLGLVEIVH